MAIYSIARNATATASGDSHFDVAAGAGLRPRIMELGIFLGVATASVFGVNRPSAIGTRTTPVALLPEDPADPALTGITLIDAAIAWSAQPTDAAEDLRQIHLPATIGVGVIWTFPNGLVIDVSKSIQILNRALNANSTRCNVSCDIS